MNWDWEKLQEKRQKQGQRPPSRDDDPDGEKPFGFDFGKFKLSKPQKSLPLLPVFVVLTLIWLGSGIFIVNPGEEGVITRFGKYDRTVGVGPHFRLPFPMEAHGLVNTQMLREVSVGIPESQQKTASDVRVSQASMFTQDENIVNIHFVVQYSISNAQNYLFNVQDPQAIIENAAESAMREVIARLKIESILTQGRRDIPGLTKEILEKLLADYDMGIKVHSVQLGDVYPPPEVKAAFIDVASAREAKATIEGKAAAYRAEIVPVATGSAISIINEAKAYQVTTMQAAEGGAARFLLMAEQVAKNPDIAKKRIYLETMEAVLSSQGVEKVILSEDSKGTVVPVFTMQPNLLPQAQPNAVPAGSALPVDKRGD